MCEMINSEEILNELRAISPMLASLEKINVFRVPADYFNNLELRIADFVKSNTITPVDFGKKNIQQVPEGYFDNLSDSIMSKIRSAYPESFEKNEDEIPSLPKELKNINPFSVPDNYFDSLSDAILATVLLNDDTDTEPQQISPLLQSVKHINVLSVPDNYFETLSTSVINKINEAEIETAEQEIRNISPMLYSIKDENVFTVPRGYFSSLAEDTIEKVKPAPAKTVNLYSKRWMKYAVAAAITGVIAFGSIKLFNLSHSKMPLVAADLSKAIKESKQYKTEADIDNALAKLDDADIAKYLEKNAGIMENELLINNNDESDLPDPEDYLISDSTLNNYLDKMNPNTKLTP